MSTSLGQSSSGKSQIVGVKWAMGREQLWKALDLSKGVSRRTGAVRQEFSEIGGSSQMTLQGIGDFGISISMLNASHYLSLQLIGSDSRNVCRHKRDRDSIRPSHPGWDGGTEGKTSIPSNLLCLFSSGQCTPWGTTPVSSVIDASPVSQPA